MADPIIAAPSTPQPQGTEQPASAQQPDGAADDSKNSKGWEAAKAQKDRADALAKELDSLRANQAKGEKERLEKQGEFQKLYEQEKAAREGIEQKSARIMKRAALTSELSGLGLTYDPRVLDLAPLDQFEIDGERVTNAALVTAEFVKASPLLFSKTGSKSGVPFPTPTGTPGGVTEVRLPDRVSASDVSSLSREQKQALVDRAFGKGTAGGGFRKT